jgi:ketosteroid isomerase-like protein
MDEMTAACRAGDAAGCAALVTGGAALLSPYAPPAHGRAAIEALHREWAAEGAGERRLTALDAGAEGGLGRCLAACSEGEGTSLSVLARQPDGRWPIRLGSLNAA